MKPLLALAAVGLATLLAPAPAPEDSAAFAQALRVAEGALEAGDHARARELIQRALERRHRSIEAWALRVRWAQTVGDRDELVYALHKELQLSVAQGAERKAIDALRERVLALDPVAEELLGMNADFIDELRPIADRYEKEQRPHSAIRVHKRILAIEPENDESKLAIERIASTPDPSLAADAKPRDLFADVSEEWILEHDAQHATWEKRAKLERENYDTYTNAGYEVLVRSGEAMEQMNAFYRQFFRYGTEEDGKTVPRIGLNIFKTRDEYLKLGIGPPVEWSGGHFTGDFVETYIPESGGFEGMVGTLFHEAAHQFVSLATRAAGWLNEGLASFFEGTEILPNGTVIMNLPARHRLYPLATRMERGWMKGPEDGLDPADPNATPVTAPTFRIIIENQYAWGPPWYAPTWGVCYFLYNYQDPIDGRFVYRDSFQEYIDASGGRVGDGAVKTFEEVVLASPKKPYKGVELPEGAQPTKLARTVDELDALWKEWTLRLRDELSGAIEVARPYAAWGRYAAENGDFQVAFEHYEKGLVASPDDPELLIAFAELLEKRFANPDRAAKLVGWALMALESAGEPDADAIRAAERLLAKLDPKRKTLDSVQAEIAATARAIVDRYLAEGLPLMVMDVAWRLGTDLEIPELFDAYEQAVRASGKTIRIWDLAYNEADLDGWSVLGESAFRPNGPFLEVANGAYDERDFDYQFVTLDEVTTGDFSIEAQVQAARGEITFCGFVFGRKDASTFHGMLLFPGKAKVAAGAASTGYVDLMSAYGDGATKTWRHVQVDTSGEREEGRSASGAWYPLRLDVSGRWVDLWYGGEIVATHEFPSAAVLRGGFGLITGRGKARFRDVRFLSRDPRDPASRIEREIRIEKLQERHGGAVEGSWVGRIPPFPEVARWAQDERSSWEEAGNVPQLLVLFSKLQNDLNPIDAWLRHLAEKHASVGLRIVSVAECWDDDELDAYMKGHPFPGAVAVDTEIDAQRGATHEAYWIRRFNLPRLVLLDLDHAVAWEGDPGFTIGQPWDPSVRSYIDDPLEDLIERRKLVQLAAWRERWATSAGPALARGDLEAALPELIEAAEFERRYAPEAARARAHLARLAEALADVEALADALERERAEPALAVALDWAALVEHEVGAKEKRALKSVLGGDGAREWERALKVLETHATKPFEPAELVERLSARTGRFPEELVAELRAAQVAGDSDAFARIVAEAPERPRLWLASAYLGWGATAP